MTNLIYISPEGDSSIYSNPLVIKSETKSGALELPAHEDHRGRIERINFKGTKFNIVETKKGFMRGGDLHQNTQFNVVFSGKVEIWVLVNGVTEKIIAGPNHFLVFKPNTPHLFHFLENSVISEWWDGPFETWYYKPYRDIIDQRLSLS